MTRPPHSPQGQSPRFRVNVLGHFDVWHGDTDATPPRGLRAAVVQLLALHDGAMHRDTLVAALWPDDAPWTGQQRLRNVLSRLRAHTGPLVGRDTRRDLVRYTHPARIDLTEFLHASSHALAHARTDPHAAIQHGTRALMLYRGTLLAGQPDADWAYPPRVHAAERYRLLLDALADASDQLGQPDQARLYRHRATHHHTP